MAKLPKLALVALLPFASACIQSIHGDGPSSAPPPPPMGDVRLLEDRPGTGRPVAGGDRVRVDFTGRYASGEVWGQGPITFIYGKGAYPGASPVRVGAVIRMQYLTTVNDTAVRLLPFPGLDFENEAYQVRRDRGPIIVEHTVRSACHPYKIFFLHTGLGDIEMALGCWTLPRSAPPRLDPQRAELERKSAEINSGIDTPRPDGRVLDPPPAPRAPADPSRYMGEYGLHRAAREGRPEVAGWLIVHGRSVSQADSIGFLPIHYVGWAQRPLQRFVPAFEQDYIAVLDTLLAHGAAIDAPVEPGRALAPTLPVREYEGQTALGFAAPECADPLVKRLLERGASPNAQSKNGVPAITGAAINGCPEIVQLLLASHAAVDADPQGGGTPIQRLCAVSAFHQGHLAVARLLLTEGANPTVAAERLEARLKDPGTGGFGFSNRPVAREILKLLRARR